jgi:thiamine kinase-like enzyme
MPGKFRCCSLDIRTVFTTRSRHALNHYFKDVIVQDRNQHQEEVRGFLQKNFHSADWRFDFPGGTGNETYFAHGGDAVYFVKLGIELPRYLAMSAIGLTPKILIHGSLADDTSIIVQSFIAGAKPSRKFLQNNAEHIATIVKKAHTSPEVLQALNKVTTNNYNEIGFLTLHSIQERWKLYRSQVSEIAGFVDESLAVLAQQVKSFKGTGLVASHNDICNFNWIVSSDGKIYLLDLDSMSREDPAVDVGAMLWWYYPPELRQEFLKTYGYANDEQFKFRMRVRMAMHCLSILLPRENSFDEFDRNDFIESLEDFKAIFAGKDNPQGYD